MNITSKVITNKTDNAKLPVLAEAINSGKNNGVVVLFSSINYGTVVVGNDIHPMGTHQQWVPYSHRDTWKILGSGTKIEISVD